MFKYTSVITLLLLQLALLSNGQSNIDLTLRSSTASQRVEIGSEGTITFTLENQSQTNATDIKVFINNPYFPPFVKFVSALGSKGSFDVASGLWTLPSLIGQETAILTMKYIPMEYGVWYAEGEVYSVNEVDADSSPNNGIDTEDDFSRSCFAMPIKVSGTSFGGRQIILEDSKITNVVWKKDGQIIQNQNANTLSVTAEGSYTFESPTFICPTQGCCPYIFEQGAQTLCCEPLEYFMSRVASSQSNNQIEEIMIFQPSSSDGKDASIISVIPFQNLGESPDLDLLAWTWYAAGLGAGNKRALIYFDLKNIPSNAVITEAKLDLYFNANSPNFGSVAQLSGSNTSNQSVIKKITQPWEELGVNWSNQPATSPENQVFIPSNTGLETDASIDITSLVRDQYTNPEESFGFMISLVNEQFYRSMLFASSDHTDSSKRPKLTIKYQVSN